MPSPKSTVTVPEGTPAPGGTGVAVAVTVTGSPATEGSGPVVTARVTADGSTACEAVPAEGLKSGSPP
ncbi:hypothetical protein [Streptomyces sioyaensis]|uniref:hypothetical protein n=1 Tax=Streptomyces sioyaensis TaxID=67364 RepID=UPI001EF0A925|nr:hypothetical protein [Streptomyces sioyaensis]